jgi:hypothetical protein
MAYMSPFEAELEPPYGLVCIRFAHIIGQYFPGADKLADRCGLHLLHDIRAVEFESRRAPRSAGCIPHMLESRI